MSTIFEIKQKLIAQADRIAEMLLPQGHKRGNHWIVGNTRGEAGQSLSICLSGSKAGLWYDFAEGIGGDILDLWCEVKGISLSQALEEARAALNLTRPKPFMVPHRSYHRPPAPKGNTPQNLVKNYLHKERCIPLEIIKRYRIGEEGEKIIFPFYKPDGTLALVKERLAQAGAKTKPTAAQCEPILFGWQALYPTNHTATHASHSAPATANTATHASQPIPATAQAPTHASQPTSTTANTSTHASQPIPAAANTTTHASQPIPATDHTTTHASHPTPASQPTSTTANTSTHASQPTSTTANTSTHASQPTPAAAQAPTHASHSAPAAATTSTHASQPIPAAAQAPTHASHSAPAAANTTTHASHPTSTTANTATHAPQPTSTTANTSTHASQPTSTTANTSTHASQPTSTTATTSTHASHPTPAAATTSTHASHPTPAAANTATHASHPTSTTATTSTHASQPTSTTANTSTHASQPAPATANTATHAPQPAPAAAHTTSTHASHSAPATDHTTTHAPQPTPAAAQAPTHASQPIPATAQAPTHASHPAPAAANTSTHASHPAPAAANTTTHAPQPAPAAANTSTHASHPAPAAANTTTHASHPTPAAANTSTHASQPIPATAQAPTHAPQPAPAAAHTTSTHASHSAPATDHTTTHASHPTPATANTATHASQPTSTTANTTTHASHPTPATANTATHASQPTSTTANTTTHASQPTHAPHHSSSDHASFPTFSSTHRTIVITEGEIDALSLAAYGYPAVSVPFGGGKGGKHNWIENEFDHLEAFETIFLATDMDQPGEEAAHEIASRLGRHRCYRVRLPRKDANDCLTAGIDAATIKAAFSSAKSFAPEGLRRASDYKDQVIGLFWPEPEKHLGYTVPYPKLKDKLHFRPAELTLWSGASGAGKSQLLSDCIPHWIAQNSRLCLASLEMKGEQSLRRLTKQTGGLEKPTKETIERILHFLDNGLILYEHVGKSSVDTLLDVFDYCRARYGCDQFIIDSLMRLGIASDDYGGQEQAVYKMVDWAVLNSVHIHLVAHARKGGLDKDIPGTEDIKGASEIGANAFNIITIWRNRSLEDKIFAASLAQEKADLAKRPGVIMNIAKQRSGDFEGKVGLWFDPQTYRYRCSFEQPPPRRYL
ncbi:phage-related protein [Bartonella tribocorum CIP 105476]|uniref:Phage-related protein n=1 Tax=Bartonella tribocorum (strain DSM 28219 / CCUG 45778 / CIP 105476 / IBS 506) TaxID=382640 RepID=A9IXX1_BART1|nr:phage-related protein [Bartonella tribocorum CIP 105476]